MIFERTYRVDWQEDNTVIVSYLLKVPMKGDLDKKAGIKARGTCLEVVQELRKDGKLVLRPYVFRAEIRHSEQPYLMEIPRECVANLEELEALLPSKTDGAIKHKLIWKILTTELRGFLDDVLYMPVQRLPWGTDDHGGE